MKTSKHLVLFFALLLSVFTASALTESIDFRDFATNSSGVLQTNTTLYEVNIRILNGSTPIYEETFSGVTTDEFGIFRIQIGTGSVVSGDYSTITPSSNLWINCRIKISSGDPYRTVNQIRLLNQVAKNAVGVGNTVESSEITDGTIMDVDINANAGIQVSKLAGGSVGDFLVTDPLGTPTWSSFPPSGAINSQPPIIGDGTGANPITLDYNTTYFDLDGSFKLIVADNAITTAKIANGAVTSAKILDGTIVNADIAANANIDVSKLYVPQNNLIVGNGANVGGLLGPGSNGEVLAIVGGAPAWTTVGNVYTETDPVWTAAISGTQTITGNW
ncbi:MAG: hypothetical protein ACP5I9_10105, partial [Candidatus Kapaibacteriota bacterium]